MVRRQNEQYCMIVPFEERSLLQDSFEHQGYRVGRNSLANAYLKDTTKVWVSRVGKEQVHYKVSVQELGGMPKTRSAQLSHLVVPVDPNRFTSAQSLLEQGVQKEIALSLQEEDSGFQVQYEDSDLLPEDCSDII